LAFLQAENVKIGNKVVEPVKTVRLSKKEPPAGNFSKILKGKGNAVFLLKKKISALIDNMLKEHTGRVSENNSKNKSADGSAGSIELKALSAVKQLLEMLGNNDKIKGEDKESLLKKLLAEIKKGNSNSLLVFTDEQIELIKSIITAKNAGSGIKAAGKTGALKTASDTPVTDMRKHTVEPLKKLKITDLRSGKKTVLSHKDNRETAKNLNSTNMNKTGTFKNVSAFRVSNITASEGNSKNHDAENGRFETVLDKIRDILKPYSVKRSSIILKDNGNGEIRLILKPESLGNIKIKLNITENHIAGKIVVENNSMRQLIENHLTDLKTALNSDGFQSSSFDVSVGNGLAGRRQYGNSERYDEYKNTADAIEEFDNSIALLPQLGREDLVVNLVV